MGLSHYPGLLVPHRHWANMVQRNVDVGRIPPELFADHSRWPAAMRKEWGDDRGVAAAREHEHRLLLGFKTMRAQLDAFKPDVVLIWGDDQYENFREDGVAQFCVFALDKIESRPFKRTGAANAWGEPADTVVHSQGHRAGGRHVTTSLIEQGFDVSYAYTMRHEAGLPHAFINAMLLLDYDRGRVPWGLPYPVIPFHVNCYGSSTISKRGAFAHIDGTGSNEPDPPGPSPARCFALGAATARALKASPWRVAVVASSSWSHSFLTGKNHYLYPDLPSDRARFEEMRDGQLDRWQHLTTPQLEDAGQQELLAGYSIN
jgi:hypothetical protein